MIKTLTIRRRQFDNLTIIAGAGLTGCPENAAFPMTETPPPGKSSSESDDCDEAVILEYNNDNDDNYNMDADMMMLFIFFTCPIHLHQSLPQMIVSVIYHILIYFLIQCDQVHDEACLLFETCFLKYFHIQSPPATSPTMGMGWAPLAAIPQVFDDDVCNDDTGNLQKAKTSATCRVSTCLQLCRNCPHCSFSSAAYQSIKWFVHCADFILY